jgi:hypothetical protein
MRRNRNPAVNPLDAMAERHIAEAQARGDFDQLPGQGEPLDLGDDALVPEELRAAYRMLKNAGFVPPELDGAREIREIEQLLRVADQPDDRRALLARIDFLLTRTGAGMRRGGLQIEDAYYSRLAEHLASKR